MQTIITSSIHIHPSRMHRPLRCPALRDRSAHVPMIQPSAVGRIAHCGRGTGKRSQTFLSTPSSSLRRFSRLPTKARAGRSTTHLLHLIDGTQKSLSVGPRRPDLLCGTHPLLLGLARRERDLTNERSREGLVTGAALSSRLSRLVGTTIHLLSCPPHLQRVRIHPLDRAHHR